ncbi:MAG: thioredoxin domain-containing protein [Proteobacteria bacterium]|nr:thioredoxin domain-containing protein [Pseudomonadota bacterium]
MNHLNNEISPYLKQHAKNPVDWHPWSKSARDRAKAEDKPMLISIGYSTCHWCHVMAKESFEDSETAAIMNEHFINIKVDREENPDIDSLYMKAVQALTGQGGWPLTVFATPDGVPFYGGTYFPPIPAHGMPSFKSVLATVTSAYKDNKEGLLRVKGQILGALTPECESEKLRLSSSIITGALSSASEHFDPVHGGFGHSMKFPHAIFLKFLLNHITRELKRQSPASGNTDTGTEPDIETALGIATSSLSAMASGGLYDALGGGFHRYTVDAAWGVPHFEKMLYDNAQLTGLYALAFEATGMELYKDAATNTAEYLMREMLSKEGGFYAAEDADSGGVEGTYYVWSPDEIKEVLSHEDAARFIDYYSVTEEGNFEGANTLRALKKAPDERVDPEIAALHAPLLEVRTKRTAPAKDKKIIVAWNALAIEAFATAAVILDREDLLRAATQCADFLLSSLRDSTGRLRRYHLGEMSEATAGLEDYALLGSALLALDRAECKGSTESGQENSSRWLGEAERIAEELIDLFYDSESAETGNSEISGRFFDSAINSPDSPNSPNSEDSNGLFVRVRDLFDNDTPSGNAATASFLLSLSLRIGKPETDTDDKRSKERGQWAERYAAMALNIVSTSEAIVAHPLYHGSMLSVLDTLIKEGLTESRVKN